MWFLLLMSVLSSTSLLVSSFGYDDLIGPGRFSVDNILQCEDADQYSIRQELSRKKLNRTHDCFKLYSELDREINTTYGMESIVYQKLDGGFKYHSTLADNSMCIFASKYLGSNWPDFLTQAKVDPPDCPIPAGVIDVNDYVMDYTQVPNSSIYGTFDITVYLLYGGEKVACVRLLITYDRNNDDDD